MFNRIDADHIDNDLDGFMDIQHTPTVTILEVENKDIALATNLVVLALLKPTVFKSAASIPQAATWTFKYKDKFGIRYARTYQHTSSYIVIVTCAILEQPVQARKGLEVRSHQSSAILNSMSFMQNVH